MIIVGIDQSYTSTGVVALKDDTEIIFVETFGTSHENGDTFKRAWDIARFVDAAMCHVKPDIIVIEGLSFGNMGNVTRNLAGLQFLIVCSFRFDQDYKVIIVPPKTLKKIATGNGKATKDEMINSLPTAVLEHFKKLGYKKSTGLKDLADAYWLCKYTEGNKL